MKSMKQKGFLKESGQMSIEYLVAFLLFASILLYLSMQVANTIPNLRYRSMRNVKLSKAYRTTGFLIKNPGHPDDWETGGNVERYGLALEPYNLSVDKLKEFNSSCNENYTQVKSKLALNRSDFEISAFNVSSGNILYLDCERGHIPGGVIVEKLQRYAALGDGTKTRLVFRIW